MPAVNLQYQNNQKWSDGFTLENTLGQALLKKPQVLEDIIYIYGDKYLLSCLTQGTGRSALVTEDSRDYQLVGSDTVRWILQGQMGRLEQVLTNPPHDGFNSVPFPIETENRYFFEGEMVRFPSGVHARVMGAPTSSGRGWTYMMQLPHREMRLHPTQDLNPAGISLAMGFSAYEELSDQGFSRQFMPEMYENYMTILRKGYGISGSALSTITWIGTKNSPKVKGKSGSVYRDRIWFTEQERQFMEQWFEDLEYYFWFAQKSMNPDGSSDIYANSGRPVKIGSGVFEQLKYSVRRSYIPGQTDFNFWDGLLKDMIQNSNSATGKKWVMCGGMQLVSEFDRAMSARLKDIGIVHENIFTDVNGNELIMKGQFTTYRGLFGAEISVCYCPMFDNPVRFGNLLHPRTNKPLMSYTGVILDFGDYGGHSNIQYLAKGTQNQDRRLIRKEIAGMVNSSGNKDGFSANSVDGTRIEYITESMIVVKNPYSCAVVEALVS